MIETLYTIFTDYHQIYTEGIKNTLLASSYGLLGALFFGVLIGSARYYKVKLLSSLFNAYVTAVRNTPLLVQIYFIYFGLPSLGITMTAMETGVLALILNSGAYISEIIRSSLNAIPNSQIEAANSLGLSQPRTLQKILLPQAAPLALPAIGGQFVQLIKDSSLLFTIAILELTKAAEEVGNETYDFVGAFMVSCLLYMLICMLLNLLVDYLEKKVSYAQ